MPVVILIIAIVIAIFILFISLLSRYKRCPSDKILVVYGKIGKGPAGESRSSKCIHGGAAFIMPVIQNYAFLDLAPISIEANLTNALSKQNIRVDVPSRFTVGISTEAGVMQNAAERLLGLGQVEIQELTKDILFGQLRLVVATMDIEDINSDRDKFLSNVTANVEQELKKIGLRLINVNVTDIKDESGYIEALGQEAAAKAINDAKQSVAEKNRDGSIGEANAHQEQRTKVAALNAQAKIGEAEATRTERIKMAEADSLANIGESESGANANVGEAEATKSERVAVATANATAVEGENSAKVSIAKSDASRREAEAEAQRRATAAEKVSSAKALEEAYSSEQTAETARAKKEKATQLADIVVPAEIQKQKIEIDAEAQAENIRRIARGEADAILFKKQAEGKGLYEILSNQAAGFDKIVGAANDNTRDAVLLLIADQLTDIVALQTEAIKNIKIDKVTVWDNGGDGKGGGNSTSNFMSGMLQSLPPMEELFKMAGTELPGFLQGKDKDLQNAVNQVVEEKTKKAAAESKAEDLSSDSDNFEPTEEV